MSQDRKEYKRAYYQAHKEERKAYYQAHKEKCKAWYKAHKEKKKEYQKAWYQAHKEESKAWYQSHKEKCKARNKAWNQAHKEKKKAYRKADVNSLGQTKGSIRMKSNRYLSKYGTKIPGYEIHHCCTYDEPYKFIYCSKEMHLKIHAYLRDNHIVADSNHYEQIKHLLDDTAILFGLD